MPTRWLNRRLVVRATICLLLGAIINVLVAWWFVLLPQFAAPPTTHLGPGLYVYERESTRVWVWKRTGCILLNEFPKLVTNLGGAPFSKSEWQAILPPSSRYQGGSPLGHEEHDLERGSETTAGWPFYSLESFVHRTTDFSQSPPQSEYRSGTFELPREILPRSWGTEVPVRPIWTGFAINSLLYATAVCLLAMIPPRIRRHLRRRAGRCPNCNYDLRATTTGACPECGAAIPPRATT